jgi:amylovoran biosynthesis glycosyltransferase AmsD
MNQSLSHIVLLCSRLDLPGGIERAVVNTASLFAAKGHKVTLLVLDDTDESFYPLSSSVTMVQHPLSFGITRDGNVITRKIKLLGDVLKLRRLLKKLAPSLIIASEYPFAAAAILAGAGKYANVISWEHHHYYELKRNLFWNKIFRLTYPRLKAIVCLNKDEQQLFASINPQTVVISNFITAGSAIRSNKGKVILTVARLTAVKGICYLLAAAKDILQHNPDWQWKLIGDGELKEEVTNFILREDMQTQLLLQPPASHEMQAEYAQASLYVMTSVNECFPMTLLEAQSAGLPCIAFDCETGPRHIITAENGVLVQKENTLQLTAAIQRLIDNENMRETMGANAKEHSIHFSPDEVYRQWQQRLFSLL